MINTSALLAGLGTILGAVGFSVDGANDVRAVISAAVALVIAVHSLVLYFTHKVTTTKAAEVQVAKANATASIAAARTPTPVTVMSVASTTKAVDPVKQMLDEEAAASEAAKDVQVPLVRNKPVTGGISADG